MWSIVFNENIRVWLLLYDENNRASVLIGTLALLQEGCEAEVEASLSPDKGVFYNVAVLLSGHRVEDAAALANCAGNPRLASLILQVVFVPSTTGGSDPPPTHTHLFSVSM